MFLHCGFQWDSFYFPKPVYKSGDRARDWILLCLWPLLCRVEDLWEPDMEGLDT